MDNATPGTEIVKTFERTLGLAPVQSARVLGCCYSTYAGYKNGRRVLPPYIRLHMEALEAIPSTQRATLLRDRLRGEVDQPEPEDDEFAFDRPQE